MDAKIKLLEGNHANKNCPICIENEQRKLITKTLDDYIEYYKIAYYKFEIAIRSGAILRTEVTCLYKWNMVVPPNIWIMGPLNKLINTYNALFLNALCVTITRQLLVFRQIYVDLYNDYIVNMFSGISNEHLDGLKKYITNSELIQGTLSKNVNEKIFTVDSADTKIKRDGTGLLDKFNDMVEYVLQ